MFVSPWDATTRGLLKYLRRGLDEGAFDPNDVVWHTPDGGYFVGVPDDDDKDFVRVSTVLDFFPDHAGGRPPEMEKGRTVSVYLDADSISRAKDLGAGNISAGIRQALLNTAP